MVEGILATMLVANPPSWVEIVAIGLSFITGLVAFGKAWNNDTKANTERITRLEGVVETLKEKNQDMGDTINKIESTVAKVELSQASMESRLSTLETKMDRIDEKLNKMIDNAQKNDIQVATILTEIRMMQSRD